MPTVQEITAERLSDWGEDLNKANATPVVLIGVSHGENSGQIVVVTTEDMPEDTIVGFLLFAATHLRPDLQT